METQRGPDPEVINAATVLTVEPSAAHSDYQEFPVPPDLGDYFLCIWTQVITGSQEYLHRVLPDACIDIVWINDGAPSVVGPWTEPFMVPLPAGTRILGARLHPGLAPGVLGIPAAELLNQSISLHDLCAINTTRFAPVLDAPSLPLRKSAFVEALARATRTITVPDKLVVAGIRWLGRYPHGNIDQLSHRTGISHRQLQRRFCAAVGYGPKMAQSVLRFQRLLHLTGKADTPLTLADLAASAGYADQSHMTREVRRFANCTPTVLLQSSQCTLRLSDLFKTEPSTRDYR